MLRYAYTTSSGVRMAYHPVMAGWQYWSSGACYDRGQNVHYPWHEPHNGRCQHCGEVEPRKTEYIPMDPPADPAERARWDAVTQPPTAPPLSPSEREAAANPLPRGVTGVLCRVEGGYEMILCRGGRRWVGAGPTEVAAKGAAVAAMQADAEGAAR